MFLINDLIALLATNLILSRALGTSTLFIAAGSKKNLMATACVITFFTTIGASAAYFIDKMLPSSVSDIRLLLYIIVIGVLYIMLLTSVYYFSRSHFEELRKFVHVSAFNCAVIGTLFTINEKASMNGNIYDLGDYLVVGIESGAGFIISALILIAAYRKLNSSKVPEAFRGFPAMLIYLGIISMAVYSLK